MVLLLTYPLQGSQGLLGESLSLLLSPSIFLLRFTGLRWSGAFTHLIQMAIFFLSPHEYKQPSCEKINACVCCGQSTASYVLQQDLRRVGQLFSSQNYFHMQVTKTKKSWQRRLAIKIHPYPITQIVVMCVSNRERIQSSKHHRLSSRA